MDRLTQVLPLRHIVDYGRRNCWKLVRIKTSLERPADHGAYWGGCGSVSAALRHGSPALAKLDSVGVDMAVCGKLGN